MKKITVLAAVLVLCAAHASAYENSYAGYSVKDGQPYYKLEAKKVYAYTNISSKKVYQNEENLKNTAVNIVNYYTAEDMEQILGEKFSTAYFDAEYENFSFPEYSPQKKNSLLLILMRNMRSWHFWSAPSLIRKPCLRRCWSLINMPSMTVTAI